MPPESDAHPASATVDRDEGEGTADFAADALSISDIGVEALLEAAGLTGEMERLRDAAAGTGCNDSSLPSFDELVGNPPRELELDAESAPGRSDFTLGFGDGGGLPTEIDSGISGINESFFAPAAEPERARVPDARRRVLALATAPDVAFDDTAPEPLMLADARASQPARMTGAEAIARFGHAGQSIAEDATLLADEATLLAEEEAPTEWAPQPASDAPMAAFSGIVRRKRGSSESTEAGASTRRPVVLRPSTRSTVDENSDGQSNGSVLGRARVATRIVRRSDTSGAPAVTADAERAAGRETRSPSPTQSSSGAFEAPATSTDHAPVPASQPTTGATALMAWARRRRK